jgi:O-antigen ligase
VAWAVKGFELIIDNPLGYGLLINSFGPLAKAKWPDSSLTHSHSGWIDLGLAFGIPGLALILIGLFGAVIRCSEKSTFIPNAGVWVLLSMALVFISSEVAERILFDYLIFLIAFFATSTINAD